MLGHLKISDLRMSSAWSKFNPICFIAFCEMARMDVAERAIEVSNIRSFLTQVGNHESLLL